MKCVQIKTRNKDNKVNEKVAGEGQKQKALTREEPNDFRPTKHTQHIRIDSVGHAGTR
jgi:hypothetical protein